MNMSKKEYNRYVARLAQKSPLGKDLLRSFLVGGLICVIGQLILNGFTALDLSEQDAAAATSVSLVFLSAVLTGLSVYDDIAKFAGAGTLVPITGFANAVVSPAIEFKAEGFVTGMAAKMFIIAGPVIVYGTVASVLYGLILVMTMGELAEASGQTRQNLSNKMTRGNFTEKDIESLASALGCSVKISFILPDGTEI